MQRWFGGRFVITDRRDGDDVEHSGEYLEIDRPRRLQSIFGVPAYSSDISIVTIDIIPLECDCELILTTELKREWADRTKEGWGKTLRTLEEML
ncbi:MAG: SRPBCC domain-containing protein [Planctomyces sp.]|nr:SRPBCC domain-containing protein [Planctomyces sp.]